MSNVRARDTLYRSSPPRARRSNPSAILSTLSSLSLFPYDVVAMLFAQLSMIRFCPSPLHRSAKPSDDNIRYRGRLDDEDGLSRRRWVTSGCAVMYGGVRLRTRNSSQGEVLWKPGNKLYNIRRVNTGGCLKGMSPKPVSK